MRRLPAALAPATGRRDRRTAGPAPQPAPGPATEAGSPYGRLPLAFVPNRGQTYPEVRYHAQSPGLGVYLTRDKAVLSLIKGKRGIALERRFVRAIPDPRIEAGAARRAGSTSGTRASLHMERSPTATCGRAST